jgi:hypothetical protein
MHRFTRIAGAMSLAFVLLLAIGVLAATPLDDPIQGTAHGAAFGADGKQIAVTAEFIARAQSIYAARALAGASVSQRARYESKRAYLDDLARGTSVAGDGQSALFARSVLLDWLIDEVSPVDAARLKQRNGLLIAWMRRGLGS